VKLTAAYLEDPRDAETAAHLGFSHVWRLSERVRLDTQSATTRSSPDVGISSS
jgi:hypothetical protein